MTFDDFICRFPKQTKTRVGVLVKCPAHDDGTASLQICKAGDGKILLKCFAGCETEAVVGSLGLKMRDLFPTEPSKPFNVPASNGHADPTTEKPVIEKIYSYQNQFGKEVYQAIRLKPKSFRQRHKVDEKWVWNMDGVERVLYHLPEIQKSETVWIVEGEKDADNLTALGFTSTCNVGGAGKWLDSYNESLSGKHVLICGDQDEPGQKHVELVFESVAGKAKTVKVVKLPKPSKDVSDFIATFPPSESAKAALEELASASHPFLKGTRLPIYSISEMEEDYKRFVRSLNKNSFSLGSWLPTLNKLRPLVPGELVFIIGDTGTGKTSVLQQIARAALPMPTILFELELPKELMFERFASMITKLRAQEVEAAYRQSDAKENTLVDLINQKLPNLFVCVESRLTVAQMEEYTNRAELKIGERPRVVLIDYIQLIGSDGVNRREKISNIAEELKIMAKATRTIVFVASQIARPPKDEKEWEPNLHSGKESGSIESSCGLLLSAWRDSKDGTLLHLKVLKSTKGGAGIQIPCNFDGERMLISERNTRFENMIKVDEGDYPQ